MIKIEKGFFSYEKEEVLKDITFSINNEKVALLGSNGSGKSTLLRILAGLYFLNRGKYYFDGKLITKKSIDKSFRKRVAILFQNPDSMIFNPTVFDEIAFSLKEFGFDNVEDRVVEMAKKFGIEKLLKKSPLNLSGGEKQKVMLCALLAYEPEILFLDEPTAAMDPRTTGWFIDFLYELKIPVLIATHDLSVAYESANRAIVMSEEHKIVYDGDIDSLMENIEVLLKANLIYKRKYQDKKFINSNYHLHF